MSIETIALTPGSQVTTLQSASGARTIVVNTRRRAFPSEGEESLTSVRFLADPVELRLQFDSESEYLAFIEAVKPTS